MRRDRAARSDLSLLCPAAKVSFPFVICWVISDYSVPGLGPGYRLTVEDAPADADVDVLAYALEA